ncbi:bacillithiol system protein YtxJ [Mesonia phycicola]|uniref:Bacillithiol system protein YtxJ n=1 Tax=Mesonia phycicola TaxID=579105 RepID=A0A1M6A7V0_9FLAO|nr:bacillithiol system redox-active protein YtxJ [Mesonia phycicola]SHI32552.1 bacillithiol system protein YtxJ [Mesonia phycicola]
MGFLDSIFKSNGGDGESQKSSTPWNELETELQIHQLIEESKEKLVVVFKHSTRCGISRMVKKQFESEYNYEEAQVKLYYLDLITYRNISNKIAEDFKVHHESPQLLIFSDEKVVYHTSHSNISAEKIEEYLN